MVNANSNNTLKTVQQFESFKNAINNHAIVALTDKQGVITEVNDLFCKISGYSRKELIGAKHSIINSGYHPKSFWVEMWSSIGHGQTWSGEICNRAKDGSIYWVETTISPLLDESGAISGYCAVRTDITHLKNLTHEFADRIEALHESHLCLELSTDGKILHANQKLLDLFEYNFSEIEGKDYSIFLSDEALKTNNHTAVLEKLNKGESLNGEFERVGKNGKKVWVQTTFNTVHTVDGEPRKIMMYSLDISKRKEIEAKLDTIQMRSKRAVKGSSDGLWDYSVDKGETWLSDHAKKIIGIQKDSANVLEELLDRIHPEDTKKTSDALRQLMVEKSMMIVKCRVMIRAGVYRWMKIKGRAEYDKLGNIFQVSGSISHIHKEECLEIKLAKTKDLLSKAERIAQVGGWELDLASNTPIWSDEVYRIHGVKVGEKPSLEEAINFYAEEARPTVKEAVNQSISTGKGWDLELPFVDAKGTRKWVRTTGFPKMKNGKCIHLHGTFQDITDQKNAAINLKNSQQAAESANKAKTEFLSNMSHEIRTPMTAILGYVDLLDTENQKENQSELTKDAIRIIRNNADHLLTIINDILDMSKIEAGKINVESVLVNPTMIIQETIDLFQHRVRGKGLKLLVQYDSDIPEKIKTDPTRLRQILINLIGNSIKFTEFGKITIRASFLSENDNNKLQIKVVDTGIGMSKQQVSNIMKFETFSQADGSTTRNYGGSGLGLNISNSLVKLLGGKIEVASQEGIGSEFSFNLDTGDTTETVFLSPNQIEVINDLCPTKPKEQSKVNLEDALLGRRILIADDGIDNQRLIAFHLKKAGATTAVVDNGEAAIHEATNALNNNEPFDLILMDIQMPILDGNQAIRKLRQSGYDLPIISLTAFTLPEQKAECLKNGSDDFLSKPIDRNRMIETCRIWTSPLSLLKPNSRSRREG